MQAAFIDKKWGAAQSTHNCWSSVRLWQWQLWQLDTVLAILSIAKLVDGLFWSFKLLLTQVDSVKLRDGRRSSEDYGWPWPSLVLCTQRNLTLMALRQNDAGVGGEGLSRVVIAIVMVGQHSLGVVASWCSLAHTWLPTRGLLPQNTQSLPDIDDAHAKLRQECLYVGLQLPLSPQ